MSYNFTMTAKEARNCATDQIATKLEIERIGNLIESRVQTNKKLLNEGNGPLVKHYAWLGASPIPNEVKDYFNSLGYRFKWVVDHWEILWD
jgi:hypothetical protein